MVFFKHRAVCFLLLRANSIWVVVTIKWCEKRRVGGAFVNIKKSNVVLGDLLPGRVDGQDEVLGVLARYAASPLGRRRSGRLRI